MSELQAVLFDMDGTLCDSEPAWMAAESALAQKHGGTWTEEDALQLVGFDLLNAAGVIKQRIGLDLTPAEIVEEMITGVIAWVAREGVDWCPGALDLVQQCNDAGVPTALVTMSYRRFAGAVVDAMPLGRFDVVVTGDEVAHGKPAPDPYLTAASALGVGASDCIVIEDSAPGAASGAAAGCLVVVVPNHVEFMLGHGMVERRSLLGLDLDGLRTILAEQ